MTQEDKNLLLKDLCARLPYGFKFMCNKNVYTATGLDLIVTDEGDWEYAVTAKGIAPIEIDFIKPYLFPMSSMTDEQREELKREYCNIACDNIKKMFANPDESHMYSSKSSSFQIDWFHKHHIDYRGLIPMGLAIDSSGLNVY